MLTQTICSLLMVLVVFAAPMAQAQALLEIDLVGQPLQHLKQSKVDGCGVRIIGFAPTQDPRANVQGLDVSFNLHSLGAGTIKGGLLEGSLSEATAGKKPTMQPISKIWLRAPPNDATRPTDGKYHESPAERNALRYATPIGGVVPLLTAIINNEPLQIGVHRKSQERETVFVGVVKLSDVESLQLMTCIKDLLQTLR